MGLPNVYIEIIRNGLGLVTETGDNTCGIILSGTTVENKLELMKPYAVYSKEGAKAIGIDPEGVNKGAYRHVAEFYDVAGNGRKLWIIVVDGEKRLPDLVDTDQEVCPAKRILNAAGGEIVALGLTTVSDEGETLDGLDSGVYGAMMKAQLLADEYSKKIMPYVTLIEGRKFIGDANALRSLKEETKYRTSIVLGSSQEDGSASVGLVLGQIAAIPVQRKISRVKNGALPIESGFLSDGVAVDAREDLDTIHDKRFIIFRKLPNKSGFFFNGDFTATADTDDLNIIARIRTIDKATKITYNTYVEELDDDVDVNDDGTLNAAVAAYLKEKIEAQVKGAMGNEISNFKVTIDTTIDIITGAPQTIYLDIIPKGYLTNIRVVLGFSNE